MCTLQAGRAQPTGYRIPDITRSCPGPRGSCARPPRCSSVSATWLWLGSRLPARCWSGSASCVVQATGCRETRDAEAEPHLAEVGPWGFHCLRALCRPPPASVLFFAPLLPTCLDLRQRSPLALCGKPWGNTKTQPPPPL